MDEGERVTRYAEVKKLDSENQAKIQIFGADGEVQTFSCQMKDECIQSYEEDMDFPHKIDVFEEDEMENILDYVKEEYGEEFEKDLYD